jgi:hypothetical protein
MRPVSRKVLDGSPPRLGGAFLVGIVGVARYFVRPLEILSICVLFLLLIATCGLWIGSYCRGDTIWIHCGYEMGDSAESERRISSAVSSHWGTLSIWLTTSLEHHGFFDRGARGWRHEKRNPIPAAPLPFAQFCFVGCQWAQREHPVLGDSEWWIDVPYWLATSVLMPLPLFRAYLLIRRWRRTRVGRCVNCGYDVRANKERCPECATPTGTRVTGRQLGQQ